MKFGVTSTTETLIRSNNPFNNPRNPLTLPSMVDVADVLHNADVPWNRFSPEDYWQRNYYKLQAEDREIIRLVSQFFIAAFADRGIRFVNCWMPCSMTSR